jgi:hypothetical protein
MVVKQALFWPVMNAVRAKKINRHMNGFIGLLMRCQLCIAED